MALDLESVRAAAKGEKMPVLTGEALDLSLERSKLRKESIDIKVNAGGRDEIPGTPEYERLQIIGEKIQEISNRLKDLEKEVN